MTKTLTEGFETFLSKLLPHQAEHDKAALHKDSVKICLEKNFKCSSFFKSGSFGNNTAIRYYSDTDYFAVIPKNQLFPGSITTLRKIKEALQTTFSATSGISISTPSVVIPFGTYASENLEITPCIFNGLRDSPIGRYPTYMIPDGKDGWMCSNPTANKEYVKIQNKIWGYRLKPLIRLVKAWKFFNQVPINSSYLELRITKYAENNLSGVYDLDVKQVMKYLCDCGLASMRDPMGICGLITASNTKAMKMASLSKLRTGLKTAEKACAEREKDPKQCFHWWKLFYNNEFPDR